MPSVRTLFEQALALAPAARAGFLDVACAGDPELRREVETLLAADGLASGFLDAAASAAMAGSSPLLGRTLGNYEIVRQLGTGGMGTVFEARQKEPVRSVALKILRGGAATPAMLARFHREAALLARLEHPGIARIYESGTVDIGGDAVPFLAMELVPEARTLTDHVRHLGLGRTERLRLFAAVCDAVGVAHARGIVHRDLKPGNVLVGADGRPRVIDFGIARELDAVATDDPLVTRTGQLIGTPRYMSPEQLRGERQGIDVRTDVWSLGLLLFELLTGEFPFALEGRSITEIATIVAERDPRRLSSGDPTLRGDLEVIVAHCLRRLPAERYADAGELQREIERVLVGEPIRARADQALYLLRRRLRRHRVLLVAAGTILVAAIGSGIGFALLWQRAVEAGARSERSLYESRIAVAANALRGFRTKELKQALAACAPEQRRWEWHHLAARADDALWTARPWPDAGDRYGVIHAVRMAPDGKLLAVALTDGSIGLLDPANGAERGRLGRHRRAVRDLAFVPGAAPLLASGSWDGSVKVFDLDSGTELRSFGAEGEVWCVAVTRDGSRLFTGNQRGEVRAWDPATGTMLWQQRPHGGGIVRLAVNHAGTVLASGGHDRVLCLTDVATGALVRRIDKSVQMSTVGLPDVLAHATPVGGVAFWGRDRFLFSASTDGYGKMWDATTGVLLFYEQTGHTLGEIEVSPDGTLLAMAASDSVIVRSTYDSHELEPLRGHDQSVGRLAFTPDGSRLLVADQWEIRCFDVAARSGIRDLGHSAGEPFAMTTSDDRSTLIAADDKGNVRVFAAVDLAVVTSFVAHQARIRNVAADATGARMWSVADDRRVRGFRLPTAEPFADAECPPRAQVHWFPGHVVVAGESADLVVRSDEDLHELRRITTPHPMIRGLAATRDGARILTAGSRGWIRVWDGKTLQQVAEWQAHAEEAGPLRFSPDETLLVSCGLDGAVRIWSPRDGALLAECTGLTSPPASVALLPDNSRMLLCTVRGDPRVLAVDTGETLLQLVGSYPSNVIWRGAEVLDGGRLVAGETAGGVHVWSTESLGGR